jgi:hypothetical protein
VKTVYEAANAVEAHMLVDVLSAEGIAARIEGEALQGAAGGLPASGLVRLVVDDEQHPAARAVLERWERTQVAPDAAVASRPAARASLGWLGLVVGVALGVGGTWAAYRSAVRVDGVDHNRDGVLDEKWTYSANGTLLRAEVDRNFDHKVDYVARYDARGLIESAEADDDFDGVFETRIVFREGSVLTTEVDTDGDGFPDLLSSYAHGILMSTAFLDPTTGRPLRVEHFRKGKLDYADIDSRRSGTLDVRIRYTPLAEVATREAIAEK